MNRTLGAIALVTAFAVPSLAQAAASAIATADVNLRAGPSTDYPVVTVVGSGNNVVVSGCLEGGSWCDVSYRGARGWIAANYLAYLDGGRRYTSNAPARLNAPVVTFSFGNYWDGHYRGYGFYRDRERYRNHHGRDDRRHDSRDRHDGRWDRHDDRRDHREARHDRRDDRRDHRGDWRDDRRDRRDDRRDDRREWWRR